MDNDLNKLIEKLAIGINNKDKYLDNVKDPMMLLEALNELNTMVGMSRAKKSIAHQVVKLIKNLNSKTKKQANMLHTVLYGPPGVGKTQVGIILAKIWYSIGYLKGGSSEQLQKSEFIETGNNEFVSTVIIFFYIFLILACCIPTRYIMWLGFLIVLIIVCYYVYYNNYRNNRVSGTKIKIADADDKSSKINDRDIISVVSRKDFVAGYVGQSALKTTNLLDNNRGKVVFIDEAYSLLNDMRDPFGNEVLTTINLYMSEHADEIGIIFAGYRDKLEHGIFESQPGLPRRCMWHFDCDPYTGIELASIFFRQIAKQNCTISANDKALIEKLIVDNAALFKSYGGDTERLAYFSQLGTTLDDIDKIDVMEEDTTSELHTITYNNVLDGLQKLKENNLKKNSATKSSFLSSLFDECSSDFESPTTCPNISVIEDDTSFLKNEFQQINKPKTIDLV